MTKRMSFESMLVAAQVYEAKRVLGFGPSKTSITRGQISLNSAYAFVRAKDSGRIAIRCLRLSTTISLRILYPSLNALTI
jgi:hypothetical protein